MTIFARKLLCTLGIAMPDEKQIAFFKSLLMDVGIVFFKLSFDRQLTSQETTCLLLVARGKNIKEIEDAETKIFIDKCFNYLRTTSDETLQEFAYTDPI